MAQPEGHVLPHPNNHVAVNLPGPGTFSATSTDDAQQFLDMFNLWADFRAMPQDQRRLALPLCFRDSAARWFSTLTPEIKNVYDNLSTAFTDRFGLSQYDRANGIHQLWKLTQNSDETARNYIDRVISEANKLHVAQDIVLIAVIQGLKPATRQFVLRSNPTSIRLVIESANLAESTATPMEDSQTVQLSQSLQRIEQQLSQMSINSIASSTVRPVAQEQSTTVARNFPSRRGRGRGRGNAFTNPSGHVGGPSNQATPFVQGSHTSQPVYMGNQSEQTTTFFNGNLQNQCYRCGDLQHFARDCYFINHTCFHCGKVGHIRQACKSKNSVQTTPSPYQSA